VNISSAIGLLVAIAGLTTTLYKGIEYLRSSEHSMQERIAACLVVISVTLGVFAASVLSSYATSSTPVGQQTIPVPFVPTSAPTSGPGTEPNITPTVSPGVTPTVTGTASPTPILAPTVSPESTGTPSTTQHKTPGPVTPTTKPKG
jgi:hypothetical protein